LSVHIKKLANRWRNFCTIWYCEVLLRRDFG